MSNPVLRKRAWALVPAIGLAVTTALAFVGPIETANAVVPKLYASPTGTGTVCGKTTPCSLSAALTKALSFTTVVLAGGVYTHYSPTITVPNLTIEGPSSGTPAVLEQSNATAPAPNASTPSGAPVTALIYVGPVATNFTLSRVTINGSQAKLPTATRFAAVYVRSSNATITHVTTASIFPAGGFDGDQNGSNIYVRSDNASTANVTMSFDNITDYNKNGITCTDGGTTCNISKSTVTGKGGTPVTAQNGIEFFGNAGSISTTIVQNNAYTGGTPQASGILVIDAVSGVVVTHNTLLHNDNQLYVYNDGGTYPTTSANVQVTKNVSNNSAAYDGMSFDSVTGAFVSQNKITGTGSADGFGIGLYGTTNSKVFKNTINNAFSDGIYIGGPGTVTATSGVILVQQNHVYTSGGDGIHADTSSHGSVFTQNTLKRNSGYDAHDQGVGNTWSSEHCTTHATSSPLGLC